MCDLLNCKNQKCYRQTVTASRIQLFCRLKEQKLKRHINAQGYPGRQPWDSKTEPADSLVFLSAKEMMAAEIEWADMNWSMWVLHCGTEKLSKSIKINQITWTWVIALSSSEAVALLSNILINLALCCRKKKLKRFIFWIIYLNSERVFSSPA